VAVKSRVAYVPDQVAFYPWMTVAETLAYVASFRARWNRDTERALLARFQLDPRQKTNALSKGQRTQLALITASAPSRTCSCSTSRRPASIRSCGASSSRR
jgi:ABC-2 type transport system ATP-binding protein